MKNSFLSFIICFVTLTSVAQIPDYFNNDPVWKCQDAQSGILPSGCYMNYEYIFYTNGDTTVGINTYKKIYSKGWENEAGMCWTSPVYHDALSHLWRQDGRKVYFDFGGTDSLYVDYGLAVGDTMTNCYLMPNASVYADSNFIVQSIDSVAINGGYNRRLHFNYYNSAFDTLHWYLLEGVGIYSEYGAGGTDFLWAIIDPFELTKAMPCYFQNGVYEYGTYTTCDYDAYNFNVGVESLALDPVHLYPNPTQNFVYIETATPNEKPFIVLIDEAGRTLYTAFTNELDMTAFDPGCYYLEITSGANQTIKKLIRQ